jgi:endoglycosylceramidase
MIAVLVVAVAMVLAACGSSSKGTKAPATTATPSPAPELRPLHATRGTDAAILDDRGANVLLRGVNVNSLGDYFQANARYPTTVPVTDADWAAMQAAGLDVVRLLMSWSRLEPTRGKIDQGYLDELHRTVAAASAHGLWVVLDMHQDAWGKDVATPADTTCPSGAKPGIGWDGAPRWATITDRADRCAAGGVRELAPAVMHAFDHFYADTDGIQGELVKTWGAVAKSFAGDPAVAGYDLLNEPNWGTDAATAGARLGAFYQRTVTAIRAGEKQGNGFAHIVFFEPVVIFPATGSLPPADTVAGPNMVFAPHNYHGSSDPGTIEQGFADEAAAAASYGTTFWVGEFGWFGAGAEDAAAVARFAAAQDRYRVGGTWWQWRQACGDPHSVGARDGTPAKVIVEFNDNGCPGDHNLGPVPEWYPILSRAYPMTAPERLTSLLSDGHANDLVLAGDATGADPSARLVVWVPDRHTGTPGATGTGLAGLTRTKVAGGWRVTAAACGGPYQLTLTASGPIAPGPRSCA